MSNSILTSVKQALNLQADYTPFDQDVIVYINAAFSTLNQLGLGPAEGFMITDTSATWDDFISDDPRYNAVKLYVILRSRMSFDPPTTSYHTSAMANQILELEWRLNIQREDDLLELAEFTDGVVLDGGGP